MRITKGVKPKPRNTLLFANGGVGKSTAAAGWPNPIMMDIECGSSDVDIARSDPIESFADFQRDMTWLQENNHGFHTVVIDTVDWLEKLVWQYVADVKGVANIADVSFGKGYPAAFNQFEWLVNEIKRLNARGIACLMLAHATAIEHSPPGEASFEKWEPALNREDVRELLCDFADEIFFLKLEEFATQEDKGFGRTRQIVKATEQRILITKDIGSVRAKNRLSMPSHIPVVPGASVFSIYADYIRANLQRAKSEVIFDSSKPVEQPQQEQPKQETPTPQGGNIAGIIVDGSSKRPTDPTNNTDAIGDELAAMMTGGSNVS